MKLFLSIPADAYYTQSDILLTIDKCVKNGL